MPTLISLIKPFIIPSMLYKLMGKLGKKKKLEDIKIF